MKTNSEIAKEKLLAGYNCAQAVLYAFGPDLGLPGDTALKVATGFGAGVARKGQICGALAGGILALGLKHGRGEQQDHSATEVTYQKAVELMSQFEKRYGSCLCRVLLRGCNLQTAEGRRHFKERDFLHKQCAGYVEGVAELLAELLEAPRAPTG